MNRFGLLGSSALCSVAFIGGSLALATPAYAQDDTDCAALPTPAERDACNANQANPAPGTTTPEGTGQTITVSGSRIARPTLESPVPVTSVGAADLLQQGTINVGDALNDLPQLRSTFSQANSTRFIGTSGLNLLDLRGLGTARTLVLVNGRRHITASPGDYLIDVNTIPDDLLERVDVVTGGNSAVYGSDAVAGVVNFILKRDFEGIRLSGQAGISGEGDRGSYFASLTAGRNFAEGRGNIAASLEYSRSNALFFRDREDQTGARLGPSGFATFENTADDGPTGSDGIPDTQFLTNLRSGSISNGGMVTASCNAVAVLGNPLRCLPGSTAQLALAPRLFFLPNGTLVYGTGVDLGFQTAGASRTTIGGLGSTVNEAGQLSPKLERYSANLLAHFDVSDAVSPYIEAKYVRIKANQQGQPSFFQGIPGFFGGGTDIRCDNPFLTAQNIAVLQGAGRCGGAVFNPNATISLNRFNVDFGPRGELHERDTYRIVAGVEGTFNDDWHYDVSANYGHLRTDLDSLNNLLLFDVADAQAGNFQILDGFLLAADAVRNAAGQIVCRVNQVTVTRPDCVPINLFGEGSPSAAALAFSNTTGHRDESASELDFLATLRGDSSDFFEMPGGPIRFSLGAEYRKEKAHSVWDPTTASGATFLNAIQPFNPPDLTVKEAFAEIEIPIVKDLPFADELTLSGAVRVSDYNTSAGTIWTYNGAVYYAPIHDVRFRANYSHSVRAPTQSDLFSPQSQNFAFIQDPCDLLFINNGGQPRKDNCAAAGVPLGFVNDPARNFTLSFLDGGNPDLDVEKSNSYTLGVIIEPRFIRGMSLTIDYYNITVKGLIASLTAQTIINSCYDAPSGLNNPFCANVFRDPVTHLFEQPVAVLSSPINFQRQKTSGIDADFAWNKTMENGDRLSLRGIFSYVLERNNFTSPTDPDFANRQLSELGDPQFEFQISAGYRTGPLNLRYQMQYIGRQTIGTYEQQHTFQGRPPTNADAFPRVWYPTVVYHNARVGWNLNREFEFYIGVDNITNRLPPLGLTGSGAGSAIFDAIGRFVYGGFKANF
jgi:outer membrane receptor protein involved in Fe transport